MSFLADRRGRVPFALLGVVLLVGSVTFAGVVSQRSPVDVDSRAATVHHEASATARSALVTATERAAHAAARAPVVDPANTSFGRVINDSTPFRDALRIRIYRQAQRAFANISPTRGDVGGTVSLPAVETPADLRRAKRRVGLERLNRTRIAVTVQNVTLSVRRGNRTVERTTLSPTVVVRSPVLSLSERVRAFEEKLNGSGLDRRLTANLYAMAWARGYAQYGGAPIANVLGTRHVGLATNAGVLDVQRAVFGRADPRGRAALTRAALRVGATDLLAGVSAANWTNAVLSPGDVADAATPDPLPSDAASVAASRTTTTGVNATADRAFSDFLTGRSGPPLEAVIDDVYEADVRLASRTEVVERRQQTSGTEPDGWRLVNTTRRVNRTWTQIADARPATGGDDHALKTYAWRVTRTQRATRTWRDGDRTRETTTTTRTERRVVVSVVGNHATTPHAPNLGISGAHETGGPLGGQNFAGVTDRAVTRLVTDRGGPRSIARRAVEGTLNTSTVSMSVPTPDGLRDWVYRDLRTLRETARNVSIETERGALPGTNVMRTLASRFEERRAALAAVPDAYGSVAEKARVAARSAYLDALSRRLDARAAAAREADSTLDDALSSAGVTDRNVTALLRAAAKSTPKSATGVTVAGAPAYLTTTEVTPAQSPVVTRATHPLVTENHNLFAVPYGDAASEVASAVVDGAGGVSLHTGATVLRAANRTPASAGTASERGERLRDAVASVTNEMHTTMVDALTRGPANVSSSVAASAVTAGLARWNTTHARALAATNGSLADAVADEVTARVEADPTAQDRRRLHLRLALRAAARNASVPRELVANASDRTRRAARALLAQGIQNGVQRGAAVAGASLSAIPAGLPVTPVPGYWWTTANAWTVEVRGQYQRFAVSAPAGSPVPASNITLVRENQTVSLDVDGDGDSERLGHNRPISFAASTTVVVAVPPGGTGVGDVNGVAVERSPGWPRPGPTAGRQGL
ncbi:MAG: hypothetical protein ABEJ68_06220 [Halobacteriaceae archaeon]